MFLMLKLANEQIVNALVDILARKRRRDWA